MSLRDDLLTPIPGEDPGGPDLRNSPPYVAIEEARREAEEAFLESGGTRNSEYVKVVQLASEFIAKKSKDLQIAAWLTEALLRREGFGGLRKGLELIEALLVGFWDYLHPREEDGDYGFRATPIKWIGASSATEYVVKTVPITSTGYSQLHYEEARDVPRETDDANKADRHAKIQEGKLTPEEFHEGFKETSKAFYKDLVRDIEGSVQAMQSLEAKGADLFKDEAPSYLALRGALSAVQTTAQKLLAEKLEMEPDPVESTPQDTGSDEDNAGGESQGAISSTPVDDEEAAARIVTAATFLRQKDPTNPASYLILRGLRWGELRRRNGKIDLRMLVAPTGNMRTSMRELELAGKWAELLEAGERIMGKPQGRGWLDLQRYALTACKNLGSEFGNVARAIDGALRDLLWDLPELPASKMMDDFPTANPDTVTWLESYNSDGPEAMNRESSHARRSGSYSMASLVSQAKAAVAQYGAHGGIEFLMAAAERAESARERFLLTSQAAEIMVDNGSIDVALPILTKLVERLETKAQTLEDWESGFIVAHTLALKYQCLPDGADGKQDLYERICRLDPVRAMTLKAKGPAAEKDQESGPETQAEPAAEDGQE